MLIKIKQIGELEIKELRDLPKLKYFMECNKLKINKSEVARQLKVDRRTVNKYLDGYEKKTTRNKPSQISKYYERIKELLSSPTQVFFYRRVLYQYLVDNEGLNTPEPTFYHYLKTIPEFDNYFSKGKITNDSSNPVIRFETKPGEQAQLDWKEKIPFVLADTGEVIDVNVLSLLLSNSRFRVYNLSLKMNREILLHLLTESFETLGGVPNVLLTDNMKTVMDEARTTYHKGKINKTFENFAKDFGFKVQPCIAGTPKTKGKVESPMKILDEIRAYSGKLTLLELYKLVERINNRVNLKLNQGSGRIPIIDFGKEKDSLLPLPNEAIRNQYRVKTITTKVNTASMISVKSNMYSVPKEYINKTVVYQIIDLKLHVYSNTKLIALHDISENKLNYLPEHYRDTLTCKFKNKNEDEIKAMAKRNLEAIGGVYTNE
ncbi:MAG: IS21 family transposase [Clostridia bacterium]